MDAIVYARHGRDCCGVIREDMQRLGLAETYTLADLAIRFALSPPAVSTVITGIRTPEQAIMNTRATQLPPLDERALEVLARHNWLRGVWYGGK